MKDKESRDVLKEENWMLVFDDNTSS